MDNPYEGFQEFIDQVPPLVQPLLIAGSAMVPYVEGEGAAAWAVIAGVHPVVAGLAAAAGNIVIVVVTVLLGARIRTAVAGFRSRPKAEVLVAVGPARLVEPIGTAESARPAKPAKPKSKGRTRLERWLVRFGVPTASLIAPLALPTMLTAAVFVASGVRKERVILWQVVAIVLWTGVVTALSTQILTVVA
ncbi:MAG: small multidrug efflux protein [Terracoccus sp.]